MCTQTGLLARAARTAQQAAIERQRELARGKARQLRRLVVAPFAQARRVQWHGHDQLRERRITAEPLTRQQSTEYPRVGPLAVKFQGAHQRIDGEIEAPGAADQVEGACLERIARSCAGQLRQARCTQVERPREPGFLAQHAAWRDQE